MRGRSRDIYRTSQSQVPGDPTLSAINPVVYETCSTLTALLNLPIQNWFHGYILQGKYSTLSALRNSKHTSALCLHLAQHDIAGHGYAT